MTESHKDSPYMRNSKLSILPKFFVVKPLEVTSSVTFTESSESCQSKHYPQHRVQGRNITDNYRQMRNPR